jgi:hypothetical protein
VVQSVVAHLAPRSGVREVQAIDEDEYFPLPRELRAILKSVAAIAAVSSFAPGSDPSAGGDVIPDDRDFTASMALAVQTV